jgi:sulfotransferase
MALLTALLSQNPRFVARSGGPAAGVFQKMLDCFPAEGQTETNLNDSQKIALWRAGIDSVYHDRPFDSVVFDANRAWLDHLDQLVRLYPLCRFIICVRNPASIANSILLADPDMDEVSLTTSANALLENDGLVGREIGKLRDALSGPHAERIFVLDYDRLADDPEDVVDVLYDFLREDEYPHDFEKIEGPGLVEGPIKRSDNLSILPTRLVLQLSGKAFWRNLKRTQATMLLGRAR